MQGGLVSLLLYLLFIATLAILGAIEWRNGNENGKLLTLFSVLLLFAGIGAPVLTSSRVNILFIVIIVILLALRHAMIRKRSANSIIE